MHFIYVLGRQGFRPLKARDSGDNGPDNQGSTVISILEERQTSSLRKPELQKCKFYCNNNSLIYLNSDDSKIKKHPFHLHEQL